MRCRLQLAWLIGLAVSCGAPDVARLPSQSRPAALAPASRPAKEVPDDSIWRIPPHMKPAQWGYHRYRGTLAGQPVQVELAVLKRPFGLTSEYVICEGSYYYPRLGVAHRLEVEGLFEPEQPLELRARCDTCELWTGDAWCATQPLGPHLSGVCVLRGSQRAVPFDLRESYAQAAHYEILEEKTTGRVGRNYWGKPDTTHIEAEYLHLLGPDTLRPALARLQCPVPARRRQARQRLALDYTPTREDFAYWDSDRVAVTLNEASLLACDHGSSSSVINQRHGDYRGSHPVYDLRTGRRLNLLAQLRPGARLALRREITRQARLDTAYAPARYLGPHELLPLPEDGFAVTPAGWDAFYETTPEDLPYYSLNASISWVALRPLLRPGTPFNRLLRVRGLRPVN